MPDNINLDEEDLRALQKSDLLSTDERYEIDNDVFVEQENVPVNKEKVATELKEEEIVYDLSKDIRRSVKDLPLKKKIPGEKKEDSKKKNNSEAKNNSSDKENKEEQKKVQKAEEKAMDKIVVVKEANLINSDKEYLTKEEVLSNVETYDEGKDKPKKKKGNTPILACILGVIIILCSIFFFGQYYKHTEYKSVTYMLEYLENIEDISSNVFSQVENTKIYLDDYLSGYVNKGETLDNLEMAYEQIEKSIEEYEKINVPDEIEELGDTFEEIIETSSSLVDEVIEKIKEDSSMRDIVYGFNGNVNVLNLKINGFDKKMVGIADEAGTPSVVEERIISVKMPIISVGQ